MFSKARGAYTIAVLAIMATACSPNEATSGSPQPPEQQPADGVASDGLTAVVMKQDFSISFAIEGVTAVSDGAPVVPPSGLEWDVPPVDRVGVDKGERVGSAVLSAEAAAELYDQSQGDRIAQRQFESLSALEGPVNALLSGRIRSEGEGWFLDAPGMDVVVDISPIQELRLRFEDLAGSATVETAVGQRTVDCQALWFEEATEPGAGTTTVALHCRLPGTVETVSGLRSRLSVSTATIEGATVVPNLMLGMDEQGYVVTMIQDGVERTIPVDVGSSNGVVRVIYTELPIGAELVQPISSEH